MSSRNDHAPSRNDIHQHAMQFFYSHYLEELFLPKPEIFDGRILPLLMLYKMIRFSEHEERLKVNYQFSVK